LIIKNLIFLAIISFFITGCIPKETIIASNSATILFKTPKLKFYDKGFIYKFEDYTQVQVFSTGIAIFDVKIYDDKICQSTFKCQSLDTFNKENLSSTYPKNFLKELFGKNEKEIIHKDIENSILIKIIKD